MLISLKVNGTISLDRSILEITSENPCIEPTNARLQAVQSRAQSFLQVIYDLETNPECLNDIAWTRDPRWSLTLLLLAATLFFSNLQ